MLTFIFRAVYFNVITQNRQTGIYFFLSKDTVWIDTTFCRIRFNLPSTFDLMKIGSVCHAQTISRCFSSIIKVLYIIISSSFLFTLLISDKNKRTHGVPKGWDREKYLGKCFSTTCDTLDNLSFFIVSVMSLYIDFCGHINQRFVRFIIDAVQLWNRM